MKRFSHISITYKWSDVLKQYVVDMTDTLKRPDPIRDLCKQTGMTRKAVKKRMKKQRVAARKAEREAVA